MISNITSPCWQASAFLLTCQEQEADFSEKITTTQRFYPEYFRVAFYGNGFPPNIQVLFFADW